MHSGWQIEMLGGLRLLRGNEVITRFRTQKTGALLAYLAFYLRRSHPREELIDRFWPEDDFHTGRHKLNVAVSALRPQLEPPGVPDGSVLVTDRLSVALNPASVATDVAEFEVVLRDAPREPDPADRSRGLRKAVELYQGPLLAGFYDAWIIPERQRLSDLFIQGLRRLTKHLREAGDLDHALDYARQAVSADPLREEAHADLIQLLAAAAQPARPAVIVYETGRLGADRGSGRYPMCIRAARGRGKRRVSVCDSLAGTCGKGPELGRTPGPDVTP